ncbi:MAG: hypothetical protein GY861_06880 [bacterium]|nr:hypothetical protein [bacterium]
MRYKIQMEAVVLALILIVSAISVLALPAGPDSMTVVGNSTASPRSSMLMNTSGGSITTLSINGTTQNMRWKAFVGNVTGKLTLDDTNNKTIYDWSYSVVQGEVYTTRATSVAWNSINCSNTTHIVNEENAMNHTNNPNDNITSTFDARQHDEFYIGTVGITQDSCYSLHTYVNDTTQNSTFQEILLYDDVTIDTGGNMVYATILEQDAFGYNNATFDFQMIVPEVATGQTSTAYYFYVELS